ncbi:MAG: Rieske 2Fe-2S domain-containing protein [Myxococcota bacterium]
MTHTKIDHDLESELAKAGVPRREWYGIAEAKRIGRRPHSVQRFGHRIVLWRDRGGTLRAHDAHCPHRGADLGLGKIVDGCLECPWHGFRFRTDGACDLVPAEGRAYRPAAAMRLAHHVVVERHGIVWLWDGPDEGPDARPAIPWFSELPTTAPMTVSQSSVWPVPFARAAEAMLDMNHAPFTHRRALPWLRPRMYDTKVEREGGLIRISNTYGWDDSDERVQAARFSVQFPGLMMGEVFPRMKLMAMISPIDALKTHVITGFYVEHALGKIRGHLQMLYDRLMITPDDLKMMTSVAPLHFRTSDFHYVPSDAAMLQWHAVARERARAQRDAQEQAAAE